MSRLFDATYHVVDVYNLTLRIKVGWRRAVGEIFTAESSVVFGDITIQTDLATTKISSEISYEYDIVHGELISLYIIFK